MISNFIYIQDNKFVGNNGVYGVGYKINLLQKYSLGKEDFEELHQIWTKAFAMLENAIILKSDFYLPSSFDTSNFSELNFLQKDTKEHFKDRPFLMHNAYIFFIKADFDTYLNTGWYNPFARVRKKEFDAFEQQQELFFAEVRNAIAFIQGKKFLGKENISFEAMNQEELIAYENMYFSGLAKGFTTNVFTKDKEVYSGDKKVGVFTVDNEVRFPQFLNDCIVDQDYSSNKYKYYKNYADSFSFNLDFAHVYNQIFFIDNTARSIKELERVHQDLKRNRSWNKQNEIASDQIQEILDSLIKNEDRRIIRGSFSVMIFEEDKFLYEKQKEKVLSTFADLEIVPHYLSSSDRIKSNYFLNFPIYTPYLNDKQLYKLPLDCACCFVTNTTHYSNDKEGVLFTSRVQNVPVTLDNYFEDKKYDNARNSIIIASTGYGKSTLVNHLVRNYYDRGDKTIIIDYGGSYSKLGIFFNDEVSYITYQDNKPLGFDIFDLIYSNTGQQQELSANDIEVISQYILFHTGIEHSKEEIEVMKRIVAHYVEIESERACFHSFYNFLSFSKDNLLNSLDIDQKYFDLPKFLLVTEDFSENGSLSFIYEQSEDKMVDKTTKAITVFELEEASKNPIVLKLLLYLSNVVIDREILKDQTIRGHIIFDEVAKMYKFDGILEQVELHYQTVRKKEAEITQVLQTIHQLPENNKSKAIIENTQVLYVLYAKDYKPIQQAFNLSEHALHEMQSLQGKFEGEKPHYSELWIMRGKHHAVYRLELPPKVFWQYQTDGAKNAVLMQEYKKTKNLQTAIENIIENEKK